MATASSGYDEFASDLRKLAGSTQKRQGPWTWRDFNTGVGPKAGLPGRNGRAIGMRLTDWLNKSAVGGENPQSMLDQMGRALTLDYRNQKGAADRSREGVLAAAQGVRGDGNEIRRERDRALAESSGVMDGARDVVGHTDRALGDIDSEGYEAEVGRLAGALGDLGTSQRRDSDAYGEGLLADVGGDLDRYGASAAGAGERLAPVRDLAGDYVKNVSEKSGGYGDVRDSIRRSQKELEGAPDEIRGSIEKDLKDAYGNADAAVLTMESAAKEYRRKSQQDVAAMVGATQGRMRDQAAEIEAMAASGNYSPEQVSQMRSEMSSRMMAETAPIAAQAWETSKQVLAEIQKSVADFQSKAGQTRLAGSETRLKGESLVGESRAQRMRGDEILASLTDRELAAEESKLRAAGVLMEGEKLTQEGYRTAIGAAQAKGDLGAEIGRQKLGAAAGEREGRKGELDAVARAGEVGIQTGLEKARLGKDAREFVSGLAGKMSELNASIGHSSTLAAMRFEMEGDLEYARFLERNPESAVSWFEGLAQMYALATAPGARNMGAVRLT